MLHPIRNLLIRQRTASVNALRGHLAEYGILAEKESAKAREL
jgi:transposase